MSIRAARLLELTVDIVVRIRKILEGRQLNINQVSRATLAFYGSASPFFIPHNFYHNIKVNKISPHLCQVFVLSKITKYSFVDWLAVFGFHLDEIPRLQMKLHSDRTVLITPVTYDKEAMVPWFEAVNTTASMEQTTPLSQIVQNFQPRRVRVIEGLNRRSFLYVKVGRQDAMAFPELAPGSIVRVDPRRTKVVPFRDSSTRREPLYLVEHTHGLSCCYVDQVGEKRIVLRPHSLPYESMEFRLSSEAVILGTVDAEIRPLQGETRPDPSQFRKAFRSTDLQRGVDPHYSLSEFVRTSRERTGLHFRKISDMSSEIAKELGDQRYATSLGALSEYETTNAMPRYIHKILSLCVLYCMDFWRYLRAAELPMEEAGKDPIPPEDANGIQENGASRAPQAGSTADGSESDLIKEIEEVPLFLRGGLKELFNAPELSLRDVYWVGRKQKVLHPHLRGGLFLIVNRRVKKVAHAGWKEVWKGPLYLILMRDGEYTCGFCSLRKDMLTVHPHPEVKAGVKRVRSPQDAEVVGEVIAVIRRISETPMGDS